MSQAPAMPVFTDALIGDTTHLSTEEFGAYCLILFATWRNNGEAFADSDRKLARICRVNEARWRNKLRDALAGFFDLENGTWRQKRLEKEWNFVAEKVRTNRENGKRGGRPKPLTNNEPPKPNGSSSVTETKTERLSTHTHTQKERPSLPGGMSAREVAESMLVTWRDECGDLLGKPTKLSPNRIKHCSARLGDLGGELEAWRDICRRIRRSHFLTERWKATVDWVLKPDNLLKIQEGNYDDRAIPIFGKTGRPSPHDAETAAFAWAAGGADDSEPDSPPDAPLLDAAGAF